MRLGTILFLAMAGTASAQTTQPTTIHVTTSAEFEKLPKVLRGGETVRLAKGEFLTKNGLRLDNRSGLTVTIEGDPGGGTIVRASGAGKAVFDPAPGSGNYVFRNLRITGGYAWRFHPPLPADLTPERAADLAAYAWRGDAEWAEVVACLTADQIHDVLIEDCEVDGAALGAVQSGIYVRNAGVRNLIVRRTKFHHTVGTEGTVDIGEWKDFSGGVRNRLADIPGSVSRDIVFEDCQFLSPNHNRACGIVTQPCTRDVTLIRCTSRNAYQYCFGLKSSGRVVLERCIAVGGDNGGFYLRGFGGESGSDSGGTRPAHKAQFELRDCIGVSPPNARGGAALIHRENCDVLIERSTIVGLRHVADHDGDGQEDKPGGGYAVLTYAHDVPCTLVIRRSIVAGFNSSSIIRAVQNTNLLFVGEDNYYGPLSQATRFTWGKKNYATLAQWQEATGSDQTSRLGDLPWRCDPTQAPLARMWPADWQMDVPIKRPCVCECD